MAVDPGTSVSAIEGIGPTTAAALQQAGVWTVLDLLRVRSTVIHRAVASLASEEEVRAWRRMAMLLQVAEVTPQWAEALVRHGIHTVEELSRKRMDEIRTLMREAKEHGVIPDSPTTTQIADMLRDAAILHHTGVLDGTVLDPQGRPLPGAAIRVGPAHSQSDDRGRFRILRIPLGRAVALEIGHPGHPPLVMERPRVASDIGVVTARVFRMTSSGAETPPAVTLSELEGDALPATYRGTRQVPMAPDELRPGDLLVVRHLYTSTPEAQLVSRLKSYREGELLVHTVRLPLSRLPADVRVKDQFRVASGQLVRVEMSPTRLHRHKIRLRLRRAFAGRPRPVGDDEVRALMREVSAFLQGQGYFRGRRES